MKNETRERVKGRMGAGGWDDYKLVLWLQALVARQRRERDARLLGNLGDAKPVRGVMEKVGWSAPPSHSCSVFFTSLSSSSCE